MTRPLNVKHDISSESARILLEIGFDAGVQAVTAAIANNDPPVINPFRRSSTTIEDVTCTCTGPNQTCPVHGSARERVQAIAEQNRRARVRDSGLCNCPHAHNHDLPHAPSCPGGLA